MEDLLTLGGLFVGTPAPLGPEPLEVLSSIRKHPVESAELALGHVGLHGDRQADMVAHGGPDKAVYMYPAQHYAFWTAEGYDFVPGGIGENATVTGQDERTVRIGDVWSWGDAVVQVSQPRTPCYKFALRAGRKEATAQMIRSGLTGWYLRVLQTGQVPVTGTLRLLARDTTAPTIHELFSTSYAREYDADALHRMVSTPALADQWRAGVLKRLHRTEAVQGDSGRTYRAR
ncbi:MOSC domain-containing protein [Streptomyces sp. NBC_00459]|uniref:MOSC domain-containing protein n=1 Tax=Streptomyces sp. NBC_00459 TaxID=2975749 RepID=UPI002E16B7AA